MDNKSRLLKTTKKLISYQTTKDKTNEISKCLTYIQSLLQGYKFKKYSKNSSQSLLFYNSWPKDNKFKIILNAHIDVVDAKQSQFKPFVKGSRLYGRGACDMKSGAAAEIYIFKNNAKSLEYPIALQIVSDEEVGGFNGTRYHLEKGVKADFAIAGEPTSLDIENMAKGIIWAKISTKGTAAHGAYPWLGDNALVNLHKIVNQLLISYPVPKKEVWKTTLNLSSITTSNNTINKVPEDAMASLDIRYIPNDLEKTLSSLKKSTNKISTLNIQLLEPAHHTPKNNKYVNALTKSIQKYTHKPPKLIKKHGASDMRHYSQKNFPGVCFGPKGNGLHSGTEWVDINSLDKYYCILNDFLIGLQ